jgi:predicted O-methyltransferase YrrM
MMDKQLANFLAELEEFGVEHDAHEPERLARMRNVTHETGVFLNLLALAARARRIVEIGTSNGYSTLWLADAARTNDGRVDTVEHDPDRAELAATNFARARMVPWIEPHVGEAGAYLAALPAGSVDLFFLDAERVEYPGFWPDLQRALVPGGLIAIDNAVSHETEMAPFRALVAATGGYLSSLNPVGKGVLLILKQPNFHD